MQQTINTAAKIVWHPDEKMVADSNLQSFMERHDVPDFDDLLVRADQDGDWFWERVLKEVIFLKPYDHLRDESRGPEFTKWCVGGKTNVVLNCIEKHRGTETWNSDAIIYESESGQLIKWSYARLSDEVDRLANGLRYIGCERGEVIGLFVPNVPEAFATFLAIAKIGAIVLPLFSGFGSQALASRLSDAGATTIVVMDGTTRRGRTIDLKSMVDTAAEDVPHLKRVVVMRRAGIEQTGSAPGHYDYDQLVAAGDGESPTEELDADAPLMIMYTSGTSGKPKGTVHTHVGFLAKLALDFGLMLDLKPSDRLMWISDMGWLVGPMIAVGVTFVGASAVVIEGGPDYPDAGRMWRLIDDHQVSFLGIAPTIARSFMKADGAGIEKFSLQSLRVLASTGEAWTPDAWHWVFDKICQRKVPILNYSGGTEVGGGILAGTVLHPMKPCAFTTAIPGMHADIVDANGVSVSAGKVGELVMRAPSIGLTRSLWDDDARYLESYWETFPGLWRHGDWVVRDEDGFFYILGRSDDTLKIAGKRTGPSEIEGLLTGTEKVAEAAVIGVPDPVKGEAVGCFVVPRNGVVWSTELSKQLEAAVVEGLGVPYRPKFIVPVLDLPKTRSMKVMRRVVKAACLNEPAGDLSSLVNPEAVQGIKDAMEQAKLAKFNSGEKP